MRQIRTQLAMIVTAIGCASGPRPVAGTGVPLGRGPTKQSQATPPDYAPRRPSGCGHPSVVFPMVEVDEMDLVQVRGARRDLDRIPRGEPVPNALEKMLDPTTGHRSLGVGICLDRDGRVACADVTVSSGDNAFDNRVLRAIAVWEFTPFVQHGYTIAVCSSLFLSS